MGLHKKIKKKLTMSNGVTSGSQNFLKQQKNSA